MRAQIAAALAVGLCTLIAQPAYAHFTGRNSVDNGEIRYENRTQYNDSLYWARDRWNDVGRIKFLADTASTIADLEVSDYTASDGLCGKATTGRIGADLVQLNTNSYSNLSTDRRRACTLHEFGHTLGLDHSYEPQVMDSCPVCLNPGFTIYIQNHDRADYQALWG